MSDPDSNRTISLVLSPREFALVKDAVDELLNDSDIVWGNCDVPNGERLYDEVCHLSKRLAKIEQMVVIPH